MISWIVRAWADLSVETLRKSYMIAGYALPPDGSRDDEIYAFKHVYPHLSHFLYILKMNE